MKKIFILLILFGILSNTYAQSLWDVVQNGNVANPIRITGSGSINTNVGPSGNAEIVLGVISANVGIDTRCFVGWKNNTYTDAPGLAGSLLLQSSTAYASPILFATGAQTAASTRMTITASGNIGINTSSPTEKLHIYSGNELINNGSLLFQRADNTGSSQGEIKFSSPSYTSDYAAISGLTGTSRSDVMELSFTTSNGPSESGERMRIDGLGNIGINVLPDPNARLKVNGNISSTGKVAIGAVDFSKIEDYSLAVNGSAVFTKAVVKLNSAWPDYVFDSSYTMFKLDSLEQFIKANGHLPQMPTAKNVEKDGIDLGNNQILLLKKIEELTLIVIEQSKQIKEQNKRIEKLETKNTSAKGQP